MFRPSVFEKPSSRSRNVGAVGARATFPTSCVPGTQIGFLPDLPCPVASWGNHPHGIPFSGLAPARVGRFAVSPTITNQQPDSFARSAPANKSVKGLSLASNQVPFPAHSNDMSLA
jgi:hypothetical protein